MTLRILETIFAVALSVPILAAADAAQEAPPAGTTKADTGDAPTGPPPPKPPSDTDTSTAAPVELTTYAQKASYILGQDMARVMKRMQKELEIEFDLMLLLRGIQDALSDKEPLLAPEEVAAIKKKNSEKVTALREAEQKKREEELKVLAKKNKEDGAAFLADNATKPGVMVMKSGLQYIVIREGGGAQPTLFDQVKVIYRGTLIDGTEFDSSEKRGGTTTFHMNRLIAGWQQALKVMKEGSAWRLFIPPELAYGEKGKAPRIEPNATIIFDLELVEVIQTAPSQSVPRVKTRIRR